MSEQNILRYAREEAELLRKRAWDLIDRLDKLESQLNISVDADESSSLKIRINNTRDLLENYEEKYIAMCGKAGISPEILSRSESDRDSGHKIKKDQKGKLPQLFLVPPRNPRFVGRKNELRIFIDQVIKLEDGAFAICGVKGIGGIGKTEIAKEVCYIFQETWKEQPKLAENLADLLSQRKGGFFQDGILWIQFDPEQQNPMSLTKELSGQLTSQHPDIFNKKIKLDELADLLAGRDLLMVMDSVEQNMRTFNYVLERFKGRFPLLITSRRAIPGIKSEEINVLNVLEPEDAETLFLCHLENQKLTEKDRETVRKLCDLLCYYPLLIKIIASRVKAGTSNLAEIFETYKENPLRLLDESNSSASIDQRHIDVRTCFMTSFNSLNKKEQHVFRHTSLFNNSFTIEELAILLGDGIKKPKTAEIEELGEIVSRFERLSLINCLHGSDGQEITYELHPLMREFALDQLKQKEKKEQEEKRKKEGENSDCREENSTERVRSLLQELQQKRKEKILQEHLKNKPSLVKQAIDAVQYCDQVFDFSTVLEFMEVLDEPLAGLSYLDDRLTLYKSAKRAVVVAAPDDYDKAHYWKQLTDMEKQQAQSKSKFEFVGRDKELTYFEDKFLFQPGSFILNFHTNGEGGVGKTQLLLQMLELCRSRYPGKIISSDELIDFYYTEARSKAGIIEQVIRRLGEHHFKGVVQQLEKYRQTKDSSEREYLLDDAVTALRKDYEVFAAKSKKDNCTILLFFDTYEVVQSIDKEEKLAKPTDFSKWLEKDFFPALQSDNTRLVVAGRYPLLDVAGKFTSKKALSVFRYKEAVDFMFEYLKIAEFTTEEYQAFLERFPAAEKLLQEFRYSFGADETGIRIYEFPNGYRKELGEESWHALAEKIPANKEEKLREWLKLTRRELLTVVRLARRRPIYLALFMYWFRFNKGGDEPRKLVKEAQNAGKNETDRFEEIILNWLWEDEEKREYIYCMTVAYRRMTSELMQHLTGDSSERCQKILLEDIRHFSFVKHKEDAQKGDVVLLHDEMRELIKTRWQNKIDSDQEKKRNILEKTIHYYKEGLLTPNYVLTDFSCSQLGQGNLLESIVDKVKGIQSFFFKRDGFLSALKTETELTKDELNKYSPVLVKAARQEVFQERREVYFPELMEYAFMVNADNGVQLFCEEFDTAIEDGRVAYAGLLGREADFCCKKFNASVFARLEVALRDVQHCIEGNEVDISQALDVIKTVNDRQKDDASWEFSLLSGKFKLWEGIAHFWKDEFEEAISLLKKARGVFIVHEGQEDLMFLAENWIGYTYYRKADFIEAESWMNQSLNGLLALLEKEVETKTRKKRNIQQHIQYAYGNLAMLNRYKGKFAVSIQYAEVAHRIVESLPRNKKEIFRSLTTMAHVLAVAGRTMDARYYLEEAEKIYKEIPDRLLGGRVYSNFCHLFYGTMEFSSLIEYYRAEELHQAVKTSQGKNIPEYVEAAEKAIALLEVEPVFHKELADVSFSLGELYMMMPPAKFIGNKWSSFTGDKWTSAEQAFERALYSARKSGFKYRLIDTLERLVILYYFQSQAGDELPQEQKKRSREKRYQYQNEIEKEQDSLQRHSNLAGRYELTLGDIHFDNALELLETDDFAAGNEQLEKAFDHYIASIFYKKKFNDDQYHLMLRVVYSRLNTLVDLAYPITFPRLVSLEQNSRQDTRKERNISKETIGWFENNRSQWEDKIEDFKWIFDQVLLLKERKVEEKKLKALAEEVTRNERKGEYWKAVLINKCLTELYWTQVNTVADFEKEQYRERLTLQLNQQSRLYRLLGDYYHAKRSYQRARKIIEDIEAPLLKKGLEGHTNIIEGEYLFRRGEFGKLLESIVVDELPSARNKFEKQFPGELQNARDLFEKGEALLLEALESDLVNKGSYQQKLSEAYFQLGELVMIQGDFPEAFRYLKKCIKLCEQSRNNFRLDDAKQSYLSAVYFSGCDDDSIYQEKIEQELEEKIKAENYEFPWVAAKFRITQGDVLFNRYFQAEEQNHHTDSAAFGRKDIVDMFRKYTEACNYKAYFNEASFAAGLRVLRRRIEMLPDSRSLDILSDIFRQIWQDGEKLWDKKKELDSILQLIRMRSLVLQYEDQ
ncbi:MAG: tetratricopeptide repeat protein [Candidatus Electrothrix aestuarii]|uniref:Tetratricopeptide repeat protein n=1 Tax=Candidatus Electrothrix aestuarii TaxID=3062594 RepID=A0AAU8LQ95_9BACT|nr:tetratricopeptide repeat protein [Candidatus Electrothrix aestuarii]